MAEAAIDPSVMCNEDLQHQGLRAYFVRSYSESVLLLSNLIERTVAEHGDKYDYLGEIYHYYGKALLELYREESEPLGDAVTKSIDHERYSDGESDEFTAMLKRREERRQARKANEEGKEANGVSQEEKKEDPEEAKESDGSDPEEAEDTKEDEEAVAGGSGTTNGEVEQKDKVEGESTEDDEEPSDLQVAWEVLELAKLIFQNRGESAKQLLAETFVALGEVSMESENFPAAIADIKQGLEIFKTLPDTCSRVFAETHYKLGMALSTNSQLEEAVENFNVSLEFIKKKMETLTEVHLNSVQRELKELNELIPEIEEKIADMKSFKEEALKTLKDSLKNESQAAAFKNDASAAEQAKDISHLVKRKRKVDDVLADKEAESLAKKPTP